jgi:hypothetical protein
MRQMMKRKVIMLRIPGSHISKYVLRNNGIADGSTEVKIIQRWNGYRPDITGYYVISGNI